MDKHDIPLCPILGCDQHQCEPLTLWVCDDHHPRIDRLRLDAWVKHLQEENARLRAENDDLKDELQVVRENADLHDHGTLS